MAHDVIVVGAGAVGLSIARSLSRERSVLLIERGSPGREASWAAAGMLCPHSEATRDSAFTRLLLASLRMYRRFAAELEDETGIDVEYLDHGTLMLASTADEWTALERQFIWQQETGLDTELLGPEDARRLEPHLSLDLAGALFCPADHQIRPRLLLEALRTSCRLRGVSVVEGCTVDAIATQDDRVLGVDTNHQRFEAPVVVLAAGAWASQIKGLLPRIEARPRKGQILSLTMPDPRFRHVIRWGRLYLVPRVDGELVIGATNEDCGFDRRLTAAGVGGLLQDAARMAAAVGDFSLRETWTGLRPLIGDGLPVIGAAGNAGLYYALGHYRNGILLAPVTASLIESLVLNSEHVADHEEFSPGLSAGQQRQARSAS